MTSIPVSECRVEELRGALRAGGMLVDVREPHEYAAGRIPGSRSIPLSELNQRTRELATDTPVYLVCRTGRRSLEAAKSLVEMGFADVRNVPGGYTAWVAMGFDSERDTRTTWTIERQVRLVAGTLVLVGFLLGVLVSPWLHVLSGAVGFGLTVAALTDSCLMGMMLMKMPWNRRV